MRYELLSKRASRSSRSSTLSDPEAKQFHFFWKFLSQPPPPRRIIDTTCSSRQRNANYLVPQEPRIGFVIEEARSFVLHLGFEQRWLRSFALEGRKVGAVDGRNKTKQAEEAPLKKKDCMQKQIMD